MGLRTWHNVLIIVGALILTASAPTGAMADDIKTDAEIAAGVARGELLWFLHAPPGTLTTEQNAAYKGATAPAPAAGTAPGATAGDWPSYNKTLTSERFSDLSQINTQNVGKLKVLCSYDTKQFTTFETGLIMVEGALIGTTEFDISRSIRRPAPRIGVPTRTTRATFCR